METSSWRSLFSTSQPGIVPTVSQTPDETFVCRARLRSGRRRRRTDGTRPPQRRPRPQRQRANSANAKFISSHLRDRRRRRWERMLRATSKTESEVDPCGPTSQTSLYAKRKCEPIFHTPSRGEFPLASTLLTQPFHVAGTLMPASQFSQTEDAIRPSEAGQSSEAETTTGKGRAKKHAADFA
jgi:hypothetical protein